MVSLHVLIIHDDRRRAAEGICPDAGFVHHLGNFIWLEQSFQLLRFDELQDHCVVGSFDLETLLNMVQEIFGAFFGYLKSGSDLLVWLEFIHQAYAKPSRHLFANVDATSMRYSADAHSSVASW